MDKKYPLKMRIYENRSYKDKSIGIYLYETEWDADSQLVLKACSSHKLYNSKLIQEKADADKKVLFGIDAQKPVKPKRKHSTMHPHSKSVYSSMSNRTPASNATIHTLAHPTLLLMV